MFPISYGRGIPPPTCGSRVVSLPLVLVLVLGILLLPVVVIRLLLLLLLLSCSLLLLPVVVLLLVLGGMYVICFDLYPFVLDV